MRKISVIFIGILILLLLPKAGWTKFVHYYDEEGKIHYINTDYAKVPDKYLPQVQAQLELPEPEPEEQPEESTEEDTEPLEEEKEWLPPRVEVFARSKCVKCSKLEQQLRVHRIHYYRYDVDYHPHGIEIYQRIGGELPITQVGEDIVLGNDIQKILALYNGENLTEEESDLQEDSIPY